MNILKPTLSFLAILLILASSYLLIKNKQVTQKLEEFNNQIASLHNKVTDNYSKLETIEVDINNINSILVHQTEKQPPAAGEANNIFYIDPINGSSNGDGSKESPWGSLQEVINSGFIESRVWSKYPAGDLDESYLQPRNEGAPITGGDTIYLMSGNYGDLSILKYYNTEPIIIKAYPGQKPVFSQIILTSSANWHFEGITIDRTGLQLGQSLFIAENHGWTGSSWDISLLNSHLTGSKDINSWGLQEWLAVGGGIRSNAERFTAIGNTIENVRHAVTIQNGVNTLFEYNTINQFAFDAIRSFGSHNSTYQYNLIKNSVYTDYSQNHDDAFQSWMVDGKPESGYIIHGNVIIDNYDLDKSPSPFLSNRVPRIQAIGLFDGPFWDWQITNNTIIVSSSHGISTDKFKNGTISDNVLMQNPKNTAGSIPQISLRAKTGTDVWPVTDNVITDNIMSRGIYIVPGSGIIADTNTLEPNYIDTELNTSIFIDYPNGSFELSDSFTELLNAQFTTKTIESTNDEDTVSANLSTPSESESTTESTTESTRLTHDEEVHVLRMPESSTREDSRETTEVETREVRTR